MNGYMKLTAALAAFALLLVLGLSSQLTLQAQTVAALNIEAGDGSGDEAISFVRSCDPYPERTDNSPSGDTATGCPATGGDNEFNIDADPAPSATQQVEVFNTSLPRSGDGTGADDNPRKFDADPGILYAVPRTTNLQTSEIKAFSGNVIRVTYTPAGTLGVVKTLTVDNVKPTLVVTSPNHEDTVKGNTNITFSAEFTDGAAGFSDDAADLPGGTAGQLSSTGPGITRGKVQLIVAGNIVGLAKGDFTAIDGGWQVSKTLNTATLQAVSSNVPWYFQVEDRAGNLQRTTTSISLSAADATNTTVTDTRFGGAGSGSTLGTDAFAGSSIRATRGAGGATRAVSAGGFASATGVFTVADFFTDDTDTTDIDESEIQDNDKFALLGTSLLIVDSKAPTLTSITTGLALSGNKEVMNRKNSIKVAFGDDGKETGDGNGSKLDPATVTTSAFSVASNSVAGVSVKNNDVYLTLAAALDSTDTPRVSIASGMIKDKAGNAYGGGSDEAGDGLGPVLDLSESADLSKSSVKITITSNELLNGVPATTVSRVIDSGEGTLAGPDAMVCDNSDTATMTELVAVPSGFDTDALACTSLNVEADATADPPVVAETYVPIPDPRRQAPAAQPQQSTARSYSYTASISAAIPDGENGGKYNVHVEGCDTQGGEGGNCASAGDAANANNAGAFTFQLDRALNNGDNPVVSVGEEMAASGDADIPGFEAVDPMIVTVDWKGEGSEYPGDSYKTVTLTSATLKVCFDDGSCDPTKTFNLTTEVSSADWVKYTIPVLNPKVGAYTLTVKGEDAAGNASGTDGHVAKWNVTAAKPVNIDLKPGWNLISLPFQPGNPAVNSVIPANHPVDIVMTFDNASQTWMVSRRDAETGLFVGDIVVMTANTAYFVRTDKFQAIRVLRPPLATAAAAPPPPPAIPVVEGWNLVPIVSNDIPTPKTIPADDYFGTLSDTGWLKALTFDTLLRTWESVSPGEEQDVMVGKGYWLYATKAGVIIP